MSVDAINATQTIYTNNVQAMPEHKIKEATVNVQQAIVSAPSKVNSVLETELERDQSYEEQLRKSTMSNSETVKKVISEINKSNPNSVVQFGVHEATNRMTIKILDKDTRKVIKEFPAEQTLDLIAKAWELAGFMIDETR